ncbi:sulfatase [Verrucomicrobiaceae bacterium N1E253]|uniref:Sulfatase n=2 Tax=Oceaniferula marina TaxID=2748318 RepID=A0A851GTF7_9BACT|nr:sulfatase [Oceaniferula marina]
MSGLAQSEQRPHIILFISDDHGWNDSGAYGDGYIKTPSINQLAAEGMKLTHAYAATPLCSPSRCVIQTGLMPHRNGGHKFGTPIQSGIMTMPEYFKKAGYYTAHFGKFHHNPRKRFPYQHIRKDETAAASFLMNYKRKQPLFLVVCSHPPHTPWVKNEIYDPSKIKLPPNFVDTPETREDRARYYSDVTLMDQMLGSVINVVDQKGWKDETLLIYTTDQGSNWPFSKWCVYDGGLRVPLIARWPGEIDPGSIAGGMVSLADLLPTCLNAAGEEIPAGIDGKSFLPMLRGQRTSHREGVFGTHTGNDNGGPGIANACPARTLRTEHFRYIVNLSPETPFTTHITGCKSGPHYLPHWDSWLKKAEKDPHAAQLVRRYLKRPQEELYDYRKDPFELNNLASHPEYAHVMKSMRVQLLEWCESQKDTEGVKVLNPLR